MEDAARIELTIRLWSRGAPDAFEDYIARLVDLLPRNRGLLERRAAEVDAGPGTPDAVLVVSFPDGASVDGFLRDPLRIDLEDLAAEAVTRSLITDSRHREDPEEHDPADVVELHPPPAPDGDA